MNEPGGSERHMRGSSRRGFPAHTAQLRLRAETVASIDGDGGQYKPCGDERIPNQGEQSGSSRGRGSVSSARNFANV